VGDNEKDPPLFMIFQRIAFTPFHRKRKGNTKETVKLLLRPTDIIYGRGSRVLQETTKEIKKGEES
jgi:hypothetical protein